jgi:class 3 adenylate cyclase
LVTDNDERNSRSKPAQLNSSSLINGDTWSLVQSYLPEVLIKAIQNHPRRNSPWIDSVEGSLVLADVSGFTAMTEKLAEVGKEGAEWLTSIINQYFKKMLDIGRSFGGSNLRFGGDALLLLFQGKDHAIRAVATAAAMQTATRQFTTFRVDQYRVHLKMTVGVHSGSFYSAAAGLSEQQMVHLVMA